MSEPTPPNQSQTNSGTTSGPLSGPFSGSVSGSVDGSNSDTTNRLTGEPSPEELEAAAAANEFEAINELAVAQAEVATLQAKNTELADSYLRAKAESENARRRADEEVSKARKFALESFAESLLPVADSLEAGLNLPSATPEQIKEGALATLKQLKAALERNRVMQIDPAAGTKFDPHQHQAISVVPAEQIGRASCRERVYCVV